MVPVSGSAYTYSYAVMGELLAWMVGWALILEYAVAAGAVSVGWSGYFVGLLDRCNELSSKRDRTFTGLAPRRYRSAPRCERRAASTCRPSCIALLVTWLLVIGTRESAKVNAVLVAIKVAALTAVHARWPCR